LACSAPTARNRVDLPVVVTRRRIVLEPKPISLYETHRGDGGSKISDTPEAQRPWSGRGQLPTVASTDLPPLFVQQVAVAHQVSVPWRKHGVAEASLALDGTPDAMMGADATFGPLTPYPPRRFKYMGAFLLVPHASLWRSQAFRLEKAAPKAALFEEAA
jgi:hypothetical protein